MATFTEIKHFIEATEMMSRMQADAKEIEQGPSLAQAGYDDLVTISTDPVYQDIYDDPYAMGKNHIQKTIKDAACYVDDGGELKVAQPNTPGGTIPLYVGTNSYDDDGDLDQDFQDMDDDGNLSVATIWDILANPQASLINGDWDAYYDNPNGAGAGLEVAWANSNSFSTYSEWDGNQRNNGQYFSAQGSESQWAPFLIFQSGGNPFDLSADVFMG